jgi:hypothetical protein
MYNLEALEGGFGLWASDFSQSQEPKVQSLACLYIKDNTFLGKSKFRKENIMKKYYEPQ